MNYESQWHLYETEMHYEVQWHLYGIKRKVSNNSDWRTIVWLALVFPEITGITIRKSLKSNEYCNRLPVFYNESSTKIKCTMNCNGTSTANAKIP